MLPAPTMNKQFTPTKDSSDPVPGDAAEKAAENLARYFQVVLDITLEGGRADERN